MRLFGSGRKRPSALYAYYKNQGFLCELDISDKLAKFVVLVLLAILVFEITGYWIGPRPTQALQQGPVVHCNCSNITPEIRACAGSNCAEYRHSMPRAESAGSSPTGNAPR